MRLLFYIIIVISLFDSSRVIGKQNKCDKKRGLITGTLGIFFGDNDCEQKQAVEKSESSFYNEEYNTEEYSSSTDTSSSKNKQNCRKRGLITGTLGIFFGDDDCEQNQAVEESESSFYDEEYPLSTDTSSSKNNKQNCRKRKHGWITGTLNILIGPSDSDCSDESSEVYTKEDGTEEYDTSEYEVLPVGAGNTSDSITRSNGTIDKTLILKHPDNETSQVA